MNNLIDFEEYRKRVRLYEESLVTEQIIEPMIEEGLFSGIKKKINAKAGIFVRKALADEIEMGEKLQEEITKSIEELREYVSKIQEEVDDSHEERGDFFKKIKKIFDDISKASFSLLTILGGVEINFADFVNNAIMANMVNFGVLFIPTRNIFLLRKAYKYFIGIIKNTIRRDLLMLQLNFDQFENTVLIESLDEDERSKLKEKMDLYFEGMDDAVFKLVGSDDSKVKGKVTSKKSQKEIKDAISALKSSAELRYKVSQEYSGRMGLDPYGNTYTKTLEQLKNFVLEDDTKYLEAITKGMRELAIDEIDTKSYVELLIDAAEECAYEVSNAIHNNFLSMISVFKLSNQKRLVELVKKDHDILVERERKLAEEERKKCETDKADFFKKKGEELYEKVVTIHKDDADYQLSEYNNLGNIKDENSGKEYSGKEILNYYIGIANKLDDDNLKDKLRVYINHPKNKLYYPEFFRNLVDMLTACASLKYTVSKSSGGDEKSVKVENDAVFDDDIKVRDITEFIFSVKDEDDYTKSLLEDFKDISDDILNEEIKAEELGRKEKDFFNGVMKSLKDEKPYNATSGYSDIKELFKKLSEEEKEEE